jgi:WD40 repeat protein
MSGVVLAIGCRDGVALWNVYRDHSTAKTDSEINLAKDRPSELLSRTFNSSTAADNHGRDTAWVGINHFKELRGVDQMAWDPHGELLAIGSAHSSTVYIRENATKRVTELRLNMRFTPPKFVRSVESFLETMSNIKDALGTVTSSELHKAPKPIHEEGHFGPTVCCMRWSPSGEYLLVAHQSEVVRIYTVATWDYIQIKDLKGAIQSACWTPDSHNILYALQGDDLIRAIHLEKRGGQLNWIPFNHARLSLEYTDVSAKQDKESALLDRFGGRSLSEMSEFGPIEELALDPNGERLIVRFRDTDLLGVVLVRPTGAMVRDLDIFLLTGFIQGPGWNGDEDEEDEESRGREPKASAMSFTNHYRGGSLLTVVSIFSRRSRVFPLLMALLHQGCNC